MNKVSLTWLKLQEYFIVFLRDATHGDGAEVVALLQLRPQARRTLQCARLIDDEVEVCAGDAQDTQLGQASQRPNDVCEGGECEGWPWLVWIK